MIADLDPRQLEAFAAVMSAGSITGAARLLGRSQPVMTRMIQDLEAALGFALLHRQGPRVTPTDKGVRFHEQAAPVIAALRRLQEQAAAIADERPAPFSIASISTLAAGILPSALARLELRLVPESVHIVTASAEQVARIVSRQECEIGFTSLPADDPGLDIHWIAEASCVAVIPAQDPLAARPSLSLADLCQRRLIAMANPFRLRQRLEAALQERGLVPTSTLSTNTSQAAIACARAGLGVAVVEPATASSMSADGVVIRPLEEAIPFFWAAVTPCARPLGPCAQGLIETMPALMRETLPTLVLHEAGARDRLLAPTRSLKDSTQ